MTHRDASSVSPHPPLSDRPVTLKRSLSWPLLNLYGLGVTLGAGIYVLVGATAAKAGVGPDSRAIW